MGLWPRANQPPGCRLRGRTKSRLLVERRSAGEWGRRGLGTLTGEMGRRPRRARASEHLPTPPAGGAGPKVPVAEYAGLAQAVCEAASPRGCLTRGLMRPLCKGSGERSLDDEATMITCDLHEMRTRYHGALASTWFTVLHQHKCGARRDRQPDLGHNVREDRNSRARIETLGGIRAGDGPEVRPRVFFVWDESNLGLRFVVTRGSNGVAVGGGGRRRACLHEVEVAVCRRLGCYAKGSEGGEGQGFVCRGSRGWGLFVVTQDAHLEEVEARRGRGFRVDEVECRNQCCPACHTRRTGGRGRGRVCS